MNNSQGLITKSDPYGNYGFYLTATHEIKYHIIHTTNIFSPENPLLAENISGNRVFCLVDSNVYRYYWARFNAYMTAWGIEVNHMVLESSEYNKNLDTVIKFSDFCFQKGIGRRNQIVCFGGGIVCDIGGLSANLIRRNTPCLKIPTSLIGIIDAAVGVKTGINFAEQKNALGTYCPPTSTIFDIELLQTLPLRQIKNGLVELIKIIALKDPAGWGLLNQNLFQFIDSDFGPEAIDLIYRSIYHMMDELKDNLYEENLKRIVDYGHEFGHVIEMLTKHMLLHGEAVGVGMLLSNNISFIQNKMDVKDFHEFNNLYCRLDIPCWHPHLNFQNLFSAISSIQKHKNGNLHLVALQRIGHPIFIEQISNFEMREAVDAIKIMKVH